MNCCRYLECKLVSKKEIMKLVGQEFLCFMMLAFLTRQGFKVSIGLKCEVKFKYLAIHILHIPQCCSRKVLQQPYIASIGITSLAGRFHRPSF